MSLPSAGGTPPLERKARPGAAAWQDPDRASHDKAVSTYSAPVLLAAAKDLGSRRAHNRRDPESRWITDRLAALARRIDHLGLNRKS